VQLSNYELGRYRVPADKRYEIAKILNRPVLELFPTETEGDKI
jgi:transcriptional regulator with XRE-family HTH domain